MKEVKLNFTKRIALFNVAASAIITLIAFVVIYWVVYSTSYKHLDDDILVEKAEVSHSLDFSGDSIILKRLPEWEEAEHQEIEVNPVFLQISDLKGNIIFTSGNLGNKQLAFSKEDSAERIFNSSISNRRIRQGQFPLLNRKGKAVGILIIAVSQEESFTVLRNLVFVLCSFFPVVLLFQYLIMQIAASKAISPVDKLIKTAVEINESNISTRLPLPHNKDELYKLTETINDLLERIEESIRQQKQFIDDASHEMRTPLSAIRGILEVLVRKRRTPEQYEHKINEVIAQTDRLALLYDQLLQLSRLESGSVSAKNETIDLYAFLVQVKEHWHGSQPVNIRINPDSPGKPTVKADSIFLEIIFNNLITNSLKYAGENTVISIHWDGNNSLLTFSDDGPGVAEDELPQLFKRFYRADQSRSSAIQGNGLGLAIVKKLAELQNIGVSAESKKGEGLSVMLSFAALSH